MTSLLDLPVLAPQVLDTNRAIRNLTKMALTLSKLTQEAKKVDPDPSDKQKEVGNYKKAHISWKGLRITIETAKGQHRKGIGKDGKPWSVEMHMHYGYFKSAKSEADGDNVDVFLSESHLDSELVFIVDQVDPDTKKFDEHKVLCGFISEETAKQGYLSNYQDGWKGLGAITAITLPAFKKWLENDETNKPFARQQVKTKSAFDNYRPVFILTKVARDKDTPFTVAVDLDGTLAEALEPFDPKKIGSLREKAKFWLDAFHDAGARIIIYTVRGDLEPVKKWLKDNEIKYDYINTNPDQPEGSSDKLFYDILWDDRAYNAKELDEHGPLILERILEEEEEDNTSSPIITIEQTKFRLVIQPMEAP